jgi:hypothetical protein
VDAAIADRGHHLPCTMQFEAAIFLIPCNKKAPARRSTCQPASCSIGCRSNEIWRRGVSSVADDVETMLAFTAAIEQNDRVASRNGYAPVSLALSHGADYDSMFSVLHFLKER